VSDENKSTKAAGPARATLASWDERYQQGPDALPWDTGEPAPELVSFIDKLELMPANILEIGCGTGTNAIWLAQQGVSVVATDISPAAIEMAKRKLGNDSGTVVDFQVADIVEANPVGSSSIDFVFDRGVYHVMQPELRQTFIDRVAEALKDGGYWLCLAGSVDEIRGASEVGPPQLKASELIDLAEVKFEIYSLQRVISPGPNAKPIVMWQAVYRKRITVTN
jgi:SAM-dependent methyltransferase